MTRSQRLSLFLGLVCLSGCHQSILPVQFQNSGGPDSFLPAASFSTSEKKAPLTSSTAAQDPTDSAKLTAARTVASPGGSKRFISLAECLALALENGRTGEYFDIAGSERRSSVTGLTRQGTPAGASDSIRVFAFDPAILSTEAEQSLSRFDGFWNTTLSWNRFDQPSQDLNPNPTPLETFTIKNEYDSVGFRTGLVKPLATGGLAGISFATDYQRLYGLGGDQFLNPGYRPTLAFTLEQPLLRGAGVPINQILDSHPGGIRTTIPPGGRVPGILLARIGQEQSCLEFERHLQELVFRVQEAYWGLYCAYWELYTRENGLKQSHQAWQIAKSRYDAGGLAVEDLAMVEEQYHSFRTQRLEALGRGYPSRPGVLEAERKLRYVLGLPADDGTQLIPSDEPALEQFDAGWETAWQQAQLNRPELKQVRKEIEAAQLLIAKAKDLLKPDLRFLSRFDVNGLGNTLGSGLDNFASQGRPEWEVGLQAQVPIGFREANSEVARAKLLLAQRYAFLRDQEQKLSFSLLRSYRDLVQYREEIKARRSQKEAAATQLQARFEKFKAGGDPKRADVSLDLLLRAQRNWSDTVRDEAMAICNYRVALADFERQKGTILNYHNVTVAEGPVPLQAHPHASRFIRERAQSADKKNELVTWMSP
jgi:outer membrane protein TolC